MIVFRLFATALLAGLMIACQEGTNGIGPPIDASPPQPFVDLLDRAIGGRTTTFSLLITGGTRPFSAHYAFSSSVDPLTHVHLNLPGDTDTLTVTFLDTEVTEISHMTVTVTDAQGLTGSSGSTFTLWANDTPIIPLVVDHAAQTIVATASDPDGEDVTITAFVPAGMLALNPVQIVPGGNGTKTFEFWAKNPFVGTSGRVDFDMYNETGRFGFGSALLNIAPLELQDDTIFAVPLEPKVRAGWPVRIVIAMGATAFPFRYMNAVRVTFPASAGPAYIANSFDTGAVDDDSDPARPIDGIWTAVGATDFTLSSESSMSVGKDLGDGRVGFDFSIEPIQGNEVTVSGQLFSFAMTFANEGTVDIGFQRTSPGDNVNRTFYRETPQGTVHFWGDDDNVHNAPNRIEVVAY